MSDDPLDETLDLIEIEEEESPHITPAQKEELSTRCKSAGIKLEEEKDETSALLGPMFTVYLPCGRETRPFYIFNKDNIQNILSIDFEKFTFIGDFAAIMHRGTHVIEAGIRNATGTPTRGASGFFRFLEEHQREGERARIIHKEVTLEGGCDNLSLKISFGLPTKEFQILGGGGAGRYTIKIEGLQSLFHDTALSLLQKITDSVFFQIDLVHDTPLALLRRRVRAPRRRRGTLTEISLSIPQHEYDSAPMSLYFYARSASELPLVQFLAFYQVLEYYFPVCHQAEARRRIRALIKDPSFRMDRDIDISRIVSTLLDGSYSGFGDERSMLKATILESTNAKEIRDFVTEDSNAAEFYKSKTKGLTDHKIPIDNEDADLRAEVADRIYDIRCRIVHTKSTGRDGSYELLLPYSKEATQLHHDIELLRFLAKKALIYASSQLKIRD